MARKNKRQSRRPSGSFRQSSMAAASTTTFEREFNPDYSQTIKDLRRIGILAGTFITILVVLSFFLR